MLTSVAALHPCGRYLSSLPTLRRIPSSTGGNIRLRQFFLRASAVRQISSSPTKYSTQAEYDTRISNYPPPRSNGALPTANQETVEETKFFIPEQAESLKITVVNNVKRAKEVLEIMKKQHAANPGTVWACDTEVADIDLSLVGKLSRMLIMYIYTYPIVDENDSTGIESRESDCRIVRL